MDQVQVVSPQGGPQGDAEKGRSAGVSQSRAEAVLSLQMMMQLVPNGAADCGGLPAAVWPGERRGGIQKGLHVFWQGVRWCV